MKKIDWQEVQKYYDENKNISIKDLLNKFHFGRTCLNNAKKKGLFKYDESRRYHKHTEETKQLLSEIRTKYLKNNPDKHPWKKLSKFKSEPCEKLKKLLKENNLIFEEEFTDITWKHNYAIDIAFPNKKIAIEINGNQHYNDNGSLKPYYQERENYLKSLGWKIYQLHYTIIYNNDIINDIIEKLKNNIDEIKIDFKFQKKIKTYCKICHKECKEDLCKGCQQKEIKNKIINERIEIVKNCNIDFSKLGWVGQLSDLFNMAAQSSSRWVKKYMPEFYENNCYKRNE